MRIRARVLRRDLLLIGLLAVSGLVLLQPGPAAAHDTLIGQSPQPDESLSAAPQQVRLDFSAEPLEVGTRLVVVNAAGADQSGGVAARIEGTSVVQDLPALPDGSYDVRWRVVSSDGHPLSGRFGFTVGAQPPTASPSTETPSTAAPGTATSQSGVSSAASQSASNAPGAAATPSDPAVGVGAAAGLPRPVLFALVGAAAAVVLAGLAVLLRRRSRPGPTPSEQVRSGASAPASTSSRSAGTDPTPADPTPPGSTGADPE